MSTALTTPESAPGRGPVTDLFTGGGPVRRALLAGARRAGRSCRSSGRSAASTR